MKDHAKRAIVYIHPKGWIDTDGMLSWLQKAWDSIDPAIISKSFKNCSISNDLDGTEDDELWAEQYDKSDTDTDEEGDEMYDDMLTREQIQ